MKQAETVYLPGDPPIALLLKPSARARRLSLRVSQLDGRVTLTLPRGASRREAMVFAQDKADWIRSHLAGRLDAIRPLPGGSVLFEGRDHALVPGPVRSARLGEGVIHLPVTAPDKTGARLTALFKHEARQRLQAASERYAKAVGRDFTRLTLRDTRSRWGSCSSRGGLMYSWRLVMAPPEVLDYVAAHEVAHLVEMNHSAAYWAVVADICPQYEAPRRWLKDNGARLHRYRFRD
ncbi:SprT family zinc-dependent metalloprotease [Aliiroseovarius subalbicans]|uniref:M48 family metallopeptidase n=1 Tax=Aliiroseovarius subalbicans TaxID=2925840 RepID=UPI001F5893DA|nr:SprT family zinc-dependent metalloprotease [Aliiroseovarius subalbicans]MCI2400670.1 M48 family metallopeptidase [Aliiroseovarius subalbicans]